MTGAWGDDMADMGRDDFEASPTKKAWQFMMANDKSPVVSGAVIGEGGEGGIYSLANGKTFRLSLRDCQTLKPGFPKWANPTPAPSLMGAEADELAEINRALATINATCLALQYDDRGIYGAETIGPLRDVAKLINRLVFQSKMPDWQDISTAPKDGRDLIMTSRDWNGDIMVGSFAFGKWRENPSPEGCSFTPTHWMPKPALNPTPAPRAKGQP